MPSLCTLAEIQMITRCNFIRAMKGGLRIEGDIIKRDRPCILAPNTDRHIESFGLLLPLL
ncbi:hypothetical protein EJ110_NYTH34861 [Nymphaea thermarum]|nr:hypothetical protein EJ110_NYTH34861 [Nymphaea thermarum]